MPHEIVADTHAAVWFLVGSKKLSDKAREIMDGATSIYISAITLIELVYLTERERLPREALERIEQRLADPNTPFQLISIDSAITQAVKQVARGQVPDMPDRIIAATAIALDVPLVTRDSAIQGSDIDTVW